MQQVYYDHYDIKASGAAGLAKHLQSRQYLGSAVVICKSPSAAVSSVRKQWLKMSRVFQRLRAGTLDAEEILHFTYLIMHMQNLRFISKPPAEFPGGDVYFVTPQQLTQLPVKCLTLYITCDITEQQLADLREQLPDSALIVGASQAQATALGLRPKQTLEDAALETWQMICDYLQQYDIDPSNFIRGNHLQHQLIDEATDILLGVSSGFLPKAADLQRAVSLARPLNHLPLHQATLFETISRLAHKVLSLSPGNFKNYLASNFSDNETSTFFLRDVALEVDEETIQGFEEAIPTHTIIFCSSQLEVDD